MKKPTQPDVIPTAPVTRRPGRPKGTDSIGVEQIIIAAKHLFFAHGISATGMDAVAKAAGITKQTLYARFPSKDDLYRAVIDDTMAQWREQQGPLVGNSKSLEEALYNHSLGTLKVATREGSAILAHFMNVESGRNPDLAKQILGPVRAKGIQDIETILAAFPVPARVRRPSIQTASEYFFMCLVGKINDLNSFRDEVTPDSLAGWARDAVKLFLNGYLAEP